MELKVPLKLSNVGEVKRNITRWFDAVSSFETKISADTIDKAFGDMNTVAIGYYWKGFDIGDMIRSEAVSKHSVYIDLSEFFNMFRNQYE